jgi:pimeloyl-ACP methyl ester carboxylesterase
MKSQSSTTQSIHINGMEIYYEIVGEGEPLVLLHGGGGIGANWELVFKDTPQGFSLVIPDLRGHGRSTNPSMEFSFRQSALDVFALLDYLGIERFQAIGLSMGAKTLLHMSTQQPTRIEAMVLVSAAPYFSEQARQIMRRFSTENHTDAEWQQMRQWHKHGDEQIQALWKLGESLKDNYTDMNFTPPYLSTIKARTLIVHGDRDPLYPVSLATEMYAAIPNSFLWVVPNGGHGPIFGEMSEDFVKTSLSFLRGEWGE